MKSLKMLRGKLGLSQQEFADRLGVTRVHVVSLEKEDNTHLSDTMVKKICEIFELKDYELLGINNFKYIPKTWLNNSGIKDASNLILSNVITYIGKNLYLYSVKGSVSNVYTNPGTILVNSNGEYVPVTYSVAEVDGVISHASGNGTPGGQTYRRHGLLIVNGQRNDYTSLYVSKSVCINVPVLDKDGELKKDTNGNFDTKLVYFELPDKQFYICAQ